MTFPATLREHVIALLTGHRAAMTSALAMGITRGDALILTIDILGPVITTIPIIIIALRRLPVISLRITNTQYCSRPVTHVDAFRQKNPALQKQAGFCDWFYESMY